MTRHQHLRASAQETRPRKLGQRKTHTPFAFRIIAGIVRPAMNVLMGKDWRDFDKFPATGFIAVANHVSEIDPLAVGHAIYREGNTLHFLAKDSLFRVPVVGLALSKTDQIPVSRGDRSEVGKSLQVAAKVLDRGGAIVIYPEGTLTRDPDLWPMRAKSGAARLALTTGAPVIPVTHWGVQDFLPPYSKRPKLLPRRKYTLQVGDEVDLSDLRTKPMTRTLLAEATQRIEEALTEGVAQLRGETPPEQIWDRASKQRVPRNQIRARARQTQPPGDDPETSPEADPALAPEPDSEHSAERGAEPGAAPEERPA